MNLQKVNDWVSKNIPFLILGALLLGLLFPKQLGVFSPYVSWMMVFQTFANSLGGGFRDLGRALTHPKPVLLTLGILHLLMPLIALGIGSALFPQDPLYTLSLVLVESSPAAVSTLIWMTIGDGNTEVCLSTVLLDSLISPIVLPLTLRLLCGSVVELDTMGLVRSLLFMVVIPAAVAMLLCRFWGKEPCTRLKRRLALPSKLMLLLIVGSNITRCADKLHHLDSALLFLMLASILMRIIGLCLGYFARRLFRLPYGTGLAVTVSSGMRNNSAAAALAAQYFPADVVFSPSISPVFSQLSVSIAMRFLVRGRPQPEKTKHNTPQSADSSAR